MERFYAIHDDLTFKPYATFGDAKMVNPYFILHSKATYKSATANDYEYAVWVKKGDSDIYERNGPISIGKWFLMNVCAIKSYFSDTEEIGFDVGDPSGELRLHFFGKAISENGIVKAIEFLKMVSKFKSWEDYSESVKKKTDKGGARKRR